MPADQLGLVFIDGTVAVGGGQLQPGDQFGQPLFQRVGLEQFTQADPWLVAQCQSQVRQQTDLVDMYLVEQGIGIGIGGAFKQCLFRYALLQRRTVQRSIQRQVKLDPGLVQGGDVVVWRLFAQGQRAALDTAYQVHDALVLQPGLIVEIAAQLFRQSGDGTLCRLTGFQPVVVHAQQPPIRLQTLYWRQGKDLVQQLGQLLLS